MQITRRTFLKAAGATTAAVALSDSLSLAQLKPVIEIGNPLEGKVYPNRSWEDVYRDQYAYDRSFTYVCSPNDTHACRVKAFVRNGVAMRIEQNYDHQRIKDLYNQNGPTAGHNPRMCLRGMTFPRRVYGPYRVKYPMMRKGWKQWADDGFPYLNKDLRTKYGFYSRGTDEFVRLTWDKMMDYVAKAHVAIAKTYGGEDGARRLIEEGFQKEMVEAMRGSGPRTFKYRGAMGLLGVVGKYGLYRLAGMMALLDANVRGVGPDKALGGRRWSNYTWHGDESPGHPWVHGMQESDIDFADMRYTKLHVQVGKNLVENKMPEVHWMIETMERGGKIVTIAPEYNPPASKADYWIPIRAGLSDIALFLAVTKIIMDEKLVDWDYVKKFTDFPLLLRTDTLKYLRPEDIIAGYKMEDLHGFMHDVMHITKEQREKIGDKMVWDAKTNKPVAITPEDVGEHMTKKGIDPILEGTFSVKTVDGKQIIVMPVYEAYKVHLKDYDLDTTAEICHAPKHLILKLARDIGTIKPVAIHHGEGINHYFHATMHNRTNYLPLMLTGNIGYSGSGAHGWAGNYKAGNMQGSAWTGPGFACMVAENPFKPVLDPNVLPTWDDIKDFGYDEEIGYFAHGDKALVVETPKYGRKNFTGKTHMPTPTKIMWVVNGNSVLNHGKWAYHLFFNVLPLSDLVIHQDIEWTGSCEYSDVVLPANSWMEFENYETHNSCSNPYIQIWKGGIKKLYDSVDDVETHIKLAEKLSELTGDKRFSDYYKIYTSEKAPNRTMAQLKRIYGTSTSAVGYKVEDIIEGKYGEPGAALMLYRTYPRQPFYEQIHDSLPFYTPTGRLQSYRDESEAIEYGENFMVHREGPEATPYLPNVIVSTNPYVRPDDYGISPDAQDPDLKTVRNIKMAWSDVKQTTNQLWDKGYRFICVTPKSRHTAHSSWANTDWNMIWNNNFGDPYRMDKRTPGVGEWEIIINPKAAKDKGVNDGDYVYCDADPKDRPYVGAKPTDPKYKVARLMVRVKYNPAYPYHVTMMKHANQASTERSVKAHETRPDGRALSLTTPYQSNFRYGSHESLIRSWLMPMHQTDSMFHKSKTKMKFMFGYEADNHGINTVPKEMLHTFSKAEDGGIGGKGLWEPVRTGYSPESPANKEGQEFKAMYLKGNVTRVKA